METKKSLLDEFFELYSDPNRVSGAKMAEESLTRMKNHILNK